MAYGGNVTIFISTKVLSDRHRKPSSSSLPPTFFRKLMQTVAGISDRLLLQIALLKLKLSLTSFLNEFK